MAAGAFFGVEATLDAKRASKAATGLAARAASPELKFALVGKRSRIVTPSPAGHPEFI